jgi:hypothetical protein
MGSRPLAVAGGFDFVAVRRGVLGVLMFVAPAYVIARVGAWGSDDSSWWLLLMFALFFGSAFGGYAAARDRPTTPISHAAVATAVGLGIVFGAALLVQLLLGDLTLTSVLTSVVYVQIGVGLGCLGGLLAARGYRP